jgi:hypothetical protein
LDRFGDLNVDTCPGADRARKRRAIFDVDL